VGNCPQAAHASHHKPRNLPTAAAIRLGPFPNCSYWKYLRSTFDVDSMDSHARPRQPERSEEPGGPSNFRPRSDGPHDGAFPPRGKTGWPSTSWRSNPALTRFERDRTAQTCHPLDGRHAGARRCPLRSPNLLRRFFFYCPLPCAWTPPRRCRAALGWKPGGGLSLRGTWGRTAGKILADFPPKMFPSPNRKKPWRVTLFWVLLD